jgi:anti-anti-sigma factor
VAQWSGRFPRRQAGVIESHVAWSVGHAVLTLRGELDQPSGSVVADLLMSICSQQPLRLFVDLTEVTAIRSVALGMLATVVGRLRQNGCPLVFINPSIATREQMHQHGLEGLLQLDPA